MSINQGAPATNSTSVQLSLFRDETAKLKISNDDKCACGTWENYTTTKVWTLTKLNQRNTISVQFRDYEGRYSVCSQVAINHDTLGPVINISLDPANTYEAGKDTRLNLSTSDPGSGVQSITCKLNGVATNCAPGSTTIVFPQQPAGSYTFEVVAKDSLGQATTQTATWTVKVPLQNITQNHVIQSNNKVDILLITDNSGSMEYEQKSMAQRMSTFINQLAGLDWRIAVTTTDPRADVAWGDGKLIEMSGLPGQTFISSTMNATTANNALSATVQRPEVGSGDEQGVLVTYRSIERALEPTANANKSFYRNDANFAAVVISDEDESATGPKNIPENLLSFVETKWPTKNFAFHSIITRPGDQQCKDTHGYSFGYVYDKMSKLTGAGKVGGATIGSVCEADYGSQLRGIGDSVQAMQKLIQLNCPPVGPATSSVIVTLNGSNYTGSYTVQGDRLVFTNHLPAGNYTLKYQCL